MNGHVELGCFWRGSYLKSGDSGGRRPEVGHVHEPQGKRADLRSCRGRADGVKMLEDHGRGQGRRCANNCQGHSFKDDWVMHILRSKPAKRQDCGRTVVMYLCGFREYECFPVSHVARSNSLKAVGTLAPGVQDMRDKKRPCLYSQVPWFKSWLCHFLPVWPWACFRTFLWLSFLIWNIGEVIVAPVLWGCYDN